jgi:hypothetical protein
MKTLQSRKFDPNHLTARDVVMIVPLALGFLILSIVFAFLVSDDAYIRWGGLAVDTGVLFSFFINESRQFLRSRRFWILTACLMILHLAGWIVFLMHVGEWRLTWFTAMILEFPAFLYLRNRPSFVEPE